MIIYLAGAETWWKKFQGAGIRNQLFSYFYLRKMRNVPTMIKAMRSYRDAMALKGLPVRYFLDSGGFTYAAQDESARPPAKTYFKEFLQFVKSTADLWEIIAELDNVENEDEGITHDTVKEWREQVRAATGGKVMPVWHPGRDEGMRDLDSWKHLCQDPRYTWLAVAGRDLTRGQKTLYTAIAHKHGKQVHGFAETKMQTEMKYLKFDSVDSSTWLRATKYGGMFIFKNNKFIILDHLHKKDRKLYKSYFKANGLDPAIICQDETKLEEGTQEYTKYQDELTKCSLIAWRNLAARYERHGRKHGPNDAADNTDVAEWGTSSRELDQESGRGKMALREVHVRPHAQPDLGEVRELLLGIQKGVPSEEGGGADPEGHAEAGDPDIRQPGTGARAGSGGSTMARKRRTQADAAGGDGGAGTVHDDSQRVGGQAASDQGADQAPPQAVRAGGLRAVARPLPAAEVEPTNPPITGGRLPLVLGPDGEYQACPARVTERLRTQSMYPLTGPLTPMDHARDKARKDLTAAGWTEEQLRALLFAPPTPKIPAQFQLPPALELARQKGDLRHAIPTHRDTNDKNTGLGQTRKRTCPVHGPERLGGWPCCKAGVDYENAIAGTKPGSGNSEGTGEDQPSREHLAEDSTNIDSVHVPGSDNEHRQGSGQRATPEHMVDVLHAHTIPGAAQPTGPTATLRIEGRSHLPVLQGPGVLPHDPDVEAGAAAWRGLPQLTCGKCTMQGVCPAYEENPVDESLCVYSATFRALPVRDLRTHTAILESLAEADVERTHRAMLIERLESGGALDPKVTAQMNSLEERLARLREVRSSRGPAGFKASVTVEGATPKQAGGMLSRLFGAGAREGDDEMDNIPAREGITIEAGPLPSASKD